jgi:NAD(P)-dependent dehydrogenase (short-subunit alcohol dehydrogenase family)
VNDVSTRTIIVTGGTSGIGRAIADGFAARLDTRVIAAGLDAVTEDGGGIEQHPLDVRDTTAVERFFAEVGAVDVLVNCAGIIRRDKEEFTESGFEAVLDVNLAGTMRCCRAAHRALAASGGCIVNTASMLSFFGSGAVPAYSASKGAITQLTRSLAIAWAGDGIRVNAIAPGWISTDLTAALEADPVRANPILARTPMGRWGKPSDLVGPVLFLASPEAGFVTGTVLVVDGGYSAA